MLERPLGFAGGTQLKFRLTQNHGGWNSDDNMNNNLGRFRFSVTTCPDVAADPVPPAVREVLAIARDAAHAGPDRRAVQLLANDGARVARGQRADRSACGGSIRPARRNWPWRRASEPRQTFLLARGDFLKPTRPVEPGTPADLAPAGSRAADAARFRPLAGQPPLADRGPGDRQSDLAGVFWHRAGGDERRFWPARRTAFASPSCSIGWRSS